MVLGVRDGLEGRAVAGADEDHVLDAGELVGDSGHERNQGVVHHEDLVLGVVDDVDELFGEQPDVERMKDGAHGAAREICFEMLLAVPAKRRDTVAETHAELGQCVGELSRSISHRREARDAVFAFVDRDDSAIPVDASSVLEDGRNQKRAVLHGTLKHPVSPVGSDPFGRQSYSLTGELLQGALRASAGGTSRFRSAAIGSFVPIP